MERQRLSGERLKLLVFLSLSSDASYAGDAAGAGGVYGGTGLGLLFEELKENSFSLFFFSLLVVICINCVQSTAAACRVCCAISNSFTKVCLSRQHVNHMSEVHKQHAEVGGWCSPA